MKKANVQKLADKIYPIVPLKTNATSSEILNNDELLENFRLSIQSVSSNMAYVKGFMDGQRSVWKIFKHIFRKKNG